MIKKKYFTIALVCILSTGLVMLMLILSRAQESTTPDKKESATFTYDPAIPNITKKLSELLKQMEEKPASDGTVRYLIDSGFFFDKRERKKYVYHKKAIIHVSQNQINKIQFEYYQFGMENMLKEIKTITNSTPNSADLTNIEITYKAISSSGKEMKVVEENRYRVSELKIKEDQRKIIYQYIEYLKLLLHKTEVLRNKLARKQTNKVDRTVNLGDREK